MGADERLLGPQRDHGFVFEAPRLPVPELGDDLPRYARRMRDRLGLTGSCAVGGVSFGAMVALEMARICPARRVIMIAGCRSGSSLPRRYHVLEWLSRLLPDGVLDRRRETACRRMAQAEDLDDAGFELIRDMARGTPIELLRRASRMILCWRGPLSMPCLVHHIHGDSDPIIPIEGVTPDEVVSGGGHLINLTHAPQVNRFIERCLSPA